VGILNLHFPPGNTAFIFPGQASQYVGMGSDLYNEFESVRSIYSDASAILGFDLSAVSFNGPIEKLTRTSVTQPAIFVHSFALTTLLSERGIKPSYAAGHSLGEFSAYAAADAINFSDVLRIVKVRAEAMQKACETDPGTMAAIIGIEFEPLANICGEVSKNGVVNIANLNSPGQLVISGDVESVHRSMEFAKEQGAKIVKELNVSGAFHSPLMESAVEEISDELKSISISLPSFPVYTNVSASPLTDPEEIRESLLKQITSPVQWYPSVQNMVNDGATDFVEIGPGKVLQGLMKRINKEINSSGIDKLESLTGIFELDESA